MTPVSRIRWSEQGTLSHIGQPDWLRDEALQELMGAFEAEGYQIYAVGGCVRDTALGGDVHDVDLSTDARPDATSRIIEGLTQPGKTWKAVPTGIEHGTVTAVASARTYEVTTFRKDVETDGRHAVVAFSDSIQDDAMRRDFTINAFYADRSGAVTDVVGGSADLRDRRIRFIGDPLERIQEDYLRILRFFRFTASHGSRKGGIDPDGLAACAQLADGLAGVSRERIGAEMIRLLAEHDPAPSVGSMEISGVLGRILPGAGVDTLARLIHLEDAFEPEGPSVLKRDVATRIASLGCEDVSDRLRLSKAQSDKIELVRKEAGRTTAAHELGYRYGYWSALHCLLLRWASLLQPFDEAQIREIGFGAEATFPVQAVDIMPDLTGKALGQRLKHLEAVWIASKFSLSKSDLLARP